MKNLRALSIPACCDTRLRHGVCDKYLQFLTVLSPSGHNDPPSGVFGSCSLAFSAKFTTPLGNAGFGYAVFCSDAFVGSSFLCVEADNLLFKFWCVTLWHNKYLFSLFIILYLISHPYYNYIITSVTGDGEIAEKDVYELDEERIREEAMYDGFYAVVTNLEGDVREIININKRRWKIEENFRIMKTEFESRPVYVQRDDRIKAHFLTCYISLLVYRLLEKKPGERFTCSQILETLRGMKMTLLSKNSGYIPSYKRTLLTDALHDCFGFRTDYEFISKSSMRNIINETKAIKSTKAKI